MSVLGQRPAGSVEEIAAAAGVSRQTVYAHFRTREELVEAVIGRITDDVIAAIDAAELDTGSAAEALSRLLHAGGEAFGRYLPLLHSPVAATGAERAHERHAPVLERLERLIRQGQSAGEFDGDRPVAWLLAAAVGLAHAAGEEVGSGRMSGAAATVELHRSVLLVFGATSECRMC